MNTLNDVRQIVRTICGDQEGQWLTSEYLDPIINHVLRLQISYLQAETHSMFAERVVVCPNIQSGTSDLSALQKDIKQPLYGLWQPYRDGLHWKQAGQPDNFYRLVQLVKRLPDVNPGVPGPRFDMWYEWRGNLLFVAPMIFNVDLRVRGDFLPAPLLKDEDAITVHPLLGDTTAEEAAACAWREKNNPGQMQQYVLAYTAALDDIANQLVCGMQGTPFRAGRANGRRR